MRRILGGVAATLLALTAVPALAADGPVLLAPCAGVADADRLTLEGLETAVSTPLLPGDVSARTVVLDLAGEVEGTTASIDALVSWTVPVNDYDLSVSGGGSSAKFNVTENPPFEQAAASFVDHCSSFTLSVENFAAPVVVDTLTAELTVTREEPVDEEFEFEEL